jgi:hypothetical protein
MRRAMLNGTQRCLMLALAHCTHADQDVLTAMRLACQCSGSDRCSTHTSALAHAVEVVEEYLTGSHHVMLMHAGALQPSPLDDLAFSKKPRAVEFQPYSMVSVVHGMHTSTELPAGPSSRGRLAAPPPEQYCRTSHIQHSS